MYLHNFMVTVFVPDGMSSSIKNRDSKTLRRSRV